MTVLGVGVDIIELDRISRVLDRHRQRFLDRLCRPAEWQERQGQALIERVGGLFAAKEAVLKALGTGWAQGLSLRQVEVVRDRLGAPSVVLHDRAREWAATRGPHELHLSISHERSYAVAFAILEGDPGYDPE